MSRVAVVRCMHCGDRPASIYYRGGRWCDECWDEFEYAGAFDDDGLYDADELGLDPEEDDTRA